MQAKPRGIDVKLFGALFMIVGAVDLVVIALFPSYSLKLFGAVVGGSASFFVKLHSPAVHLLIGFGFLWLRPWAWGLAVAYGGFGIVSEVMNQVTFGFHAVRTISTLVFLGYLIWRRSLFSNMTVEERPPKEASRGAP